MNSIIEKSSESARALLFGLLADCPFLKCEKENCSLWNLRNSLAGEKKYAYVMGLSKEEIENILVQHEECYKRNF